MHFYESRVMWTKDGLQFKSYANQHPKNFVIAKPKYVPTQKLRSKHFQQRVINGKRVNRFDYWIKDAELKRYVFEFKKAYPDYIYECDLHKNWFFGVPKEKIHFLPDPRQGIKNLLKKNKDELNKYLSLTKGFTLFLLESGIKEKDIGLTNSTLLGNYTYGKSDIDIIVFGKDNAWKVINFLKTAKNPMLRWRTNAEWKKYYKSYNSGLNFSEKKFIFHAKRKFSDGFFGETVFSIFGVEEKKDSISKWGNEKYEPIGLITIKGKITEDYHGITRPATYEIESQTKNVKQVVSFARDFMLQAKKGEKIRARGMLEKVIPKKGEEFHRIVIGYFESYLSYKGQDFLKVV